ncbi:MAG: cbb3-type cytochrome c oxidase subunit 3 [Pseudomonadota bacterium]
MDLTVLRSLVTLISFIVFIGIVFWAWSGKNRARFQEAAMLPFADDDIANRVDAPRHSAK